MKRMDVNGLGGLLLLFILIPPVCAAIQYEVIDLGSGMVPIAISNNGKVLLSEQLGYAEFKLYIWENGQSVLLDHFPRSHLGYGSQINNDGQTIANLNEEPSFDYSSCVWTNGQRTTYQDMYLWDINNHGQILCSGRDEDNAIFMFVIQPDGQEIIYEKYTIGTSLNDHGHIAGTYNDIGMIWNPDGTIIQILDPLEGHLYSCGMVLNNQNQVLGYSTDAFVYDYDTEISLVLWDPAEGRIDLNCTYGLYHGSPFDINDQGQVVGMLKRPGDSDFEPYLWQQETGFINLGDLVQGLGSVLRINDQGEIIGTSGGHGILLVPVPEPGSVVLMLLGAGLIKRFRKS